MSFGSSKSKPPNITSMPVSPPPTIINIPEEGRAELLKQRWKKGRKSTILTQSANGDRTSVLG